MKKSIYLDYAAATPLDPRVLKTMEPIWAKDFYNTSASYLTAREVRRKLNGARTDIAKCLGAKPAEIIFTAGATEANNLAIQGVMKAFPGGKLLVSAIEHKSVLEPAKLFKAEQVPVDKKGVILLNKLSNLINDDTVLISVMLVNNEIGSIQPLRTIAETVKDLRRARKAYGNRLPLYLHSDAAQAGNYLDLKTNRYGVDLMTINGSKIYGPKQSGVLFVKAGTILQPLILGGGQEFGLRSGTENLAGAVGLAEALRLAQERRTDEAKRVTILRDLFVAEVRARFPKVILNPPKFYENFRRASHQSPHIVSVTFPKVDDERLMMELDDAGVICAVGSACSASSDKPSYVLRAIGLSDDLARATLRFSFGSKTSKDDILRTVKILAHLISNR
jgi:cysteine desulfurase